MKDFNLGFASGIFLSIGIMLVLGGLIVSGIVSIVLSLFISFIMYGHYNYINKNK